MGFIITGECLGTESTTRRKKNGEEFDVVTIHVLDGVNVTKLDAGDRFRGALPTRGEIVALEAGVSVWTPVNERGPGEPRLQFKAYGRAANDVEAALVSTRVGKTSPPVAAVK